MKYIFALLGFALLSACVPTASEDKASNTPLAQFATCLKEKGATFYGTEWCPHCKKQKALFGPQNLSFVPYVNCEEKSIACRKAGVSAYPTWIFADGSKKEGTQSLKSLAKKTGCSLEGAL